MLPPYGIVNSSIGPETALSPDLAPKHTGARRTLAKLPGIIARAVRSVKSTCQLGTAHFNAAWRAGIPQG
jgi:hypothetical protein